MPRATHQTFVGSCDLFGWRKAKDIEARRRELSRRIQTLKPNSWRRIELQAELQQLTTEIAAIDHRGFKIGNKTMTELLKAQLAKLHIAKKQLGLDEDTWRDLLERETGKRSTKAMSDDERGRVLDKLKKQGFKPASTGTRKGLEGAYAPKLQALWIAGYNLGLIRNKDDKALTAFVKRQTGLDATRFLYYPEDANKAIEAVKGWLARDGGVDWSKDRFLPDWTQANGYRIAKAQHRMLAEIQSLNSQKIEDWLAINGFPSPALMTDQSWIEAMNKMGREIRKIKQQKGDV